MLWLIYSLIAAFSDGFKRLLHRHIMKTEDPCSYAAVENILTAAVFLPILYSEFMIPYGWYPWFLVFVSSLLWVTVALVGLNAYKYTPA